MRIFVYKIEVYRMREREKSAISSYKTLMLLDQGLALMTLFNFNL